MSDSKKEKMKIYNRANRLKEKLSASNPNAPGKVDDTAMDEAERMIEVLCQAYGENIEGLLANIEAKWCDIRDMARSEEREQKALELFTLAHEVKDVSAQCGYELMAYFAEHLRDYVTHTDYSFEAQKVITQACVDSMKVVHKLELKTDGGEQAEELKKVLKQAIDKFS